MDKKEERKGQAGKGTGVLRNTKIVTTSKEGMGEESIKAVCDKNNNQQSPTPSL